MTVVSQAEEQVASLQMAVDIQLPQERQRKQQRMQQISQALDGSGVTQVRPHPSNFSSVTDPAAFRMQEPFNRHLRHVTYPVASLRMQRGKSRVVWAAACSADDGWPIHLLLCCT